MAVPRNMAEYLAMQRASGGSTITSLAGTTPSSVASRIRSSGATSGEANRFANIASAPTPVRSSGSSAGERNYSTGSGSSAGERNYFRGSGSSAGEVPVQITPAPVREVTTTPVQTTPAPTGPVQETTPTPTPSPSPAPSAPAPTPEPEPTPYNVYDDPNYQSALAAAQSQFNLERIGALGAKQYQDLAIERTLEGRPDIAEQQRRRLAGNYASRGMGGGRYGALTRAEAELNAGELAQRTGLREQMAELDRQFTSQYGAEGTDWLGTYRGQQAQQNAIQQALAARLGGLTTV